jgi:hypothetical protein
MRVNNLFDNAKPNRYRSLFQGQKKLLALLVPITVEIYWKDQETLFEEETKRGKLSNHLPLKKNRIAAAQHQQFQTTLKGRRGISC